MVWQFRFRFGFGRKLTFIFGGGFVFGRKRKTYFRSVFSNTFTRDGSMTRIWQLCTSPRKSCMIYPDFLWKTNHSWVKSSSSYHLTHLTVIFNIVSQNSMPWHLITLANMDQFSNLFHHLIRKKILYDMSQTFPPHLQYLATLPCESRKSKNVADFDSIINKLLTCSWGHFEVLI